VRRLGEPPPRRERGLRAAEEPRIGQRAVAAEIGARQLDRATTAAAWGGV
jgi:hypothetical protein